VYAFFICIGDENGEEEEHGYVIKKMRFIQL
jgi:hypothetical protein